MNFMENKHKIYWLIKEYLSSNINESTFCDEFYNCYDLELNKDTLNSFEKKVLDELSQVASRFSPYKEDHKLDAKAFSTVAELNSQIKKTNDLLVNLMN